MTGIPLDTKPGGWLTPTVHNWAVAVSAENNNVLVTILALNENVNEPAFQATFLMTTNSDFEAAIC
jgi:hypothetical protein